MSEETQTKENAMKNRMFGAIKAMMNAIIDPLKMRKTMFHRENDKPRVRKGRSIRNYDKGLTGDLVRMCPGGRHAIYRTRIGDVRKELAA